MTVYFAPLVNEQVIDDSGNPMVGAWWRAYLAGTTTPATTYTSNTGLTAQPTDILLNASGLPANPVWMTGGVPLKFRLYSAAGVILRTVDNISGINDPAGITAQSQWVLYGGAPTYISATSFSLVGDQTGTFQIGRRLQSTNTGGTIYSSITNSVFGAVTTVTVTNDSGSLDSGMSAVYYGLISATNTSAPATLVRTGAATASGLTMTTATILGRTTASTGAIEEISVGAGLSFSSTTLAATLARGYLDGCTLSTAGSSATMSIAAGLCTDSTNAAYMSLSAIAKTTSAWAVGTGNGGLDTGAIANSTWYHFYVIRRPDTVVVDVVFSTSASAPTLPTNYTQYRRIGSGKTNGSAQWTSFVQTGDDFQWLSPTLDVNAASSGTSAVSRTLTVPTGVSVVARMNVVVVAGAGGEGALLSDLAVTDAAASSSATPLCQLSAGNSQTVAGQLTIRTNTSAQIRSRQSVGGASETLRIATTGWTDARGKS